MPDGRTSCDDNAVVTTTTTTTTERQTEMVSAHGELEVVLGVLPVGVLQVQNDTSIVDQYRQLLAACTETADERPH